MRSLEFGIAVVAAVVSVASCTPVNTPRLETSDAGPDAAEGTKESPVATRDAATIADAAIGSSPVEAGTRPGPEGGEHTGGGGRPAQSGSGGAGGAAGGGGASEPMREACTTAGAMRCASSGQAGARERCQDGAWQADAACAEAEICTDRPAAGSCQALAAVCKGSAGKSVCDAAGVMYDCDDQGVVIEMRACTSARHCQLGVEKRTCFSCIPGEFRCSEVQLEKCGDDGQAFAPVKRCDTAALCNVTAGDCTSAACMPNQFVCQGDKLRKCNADQTALMDVAPCQPGLCDPMGGQCDVCSPGAKGCDGDMVVTCNAQGQGSTRAACAADKSHCVGAGQCVACAEDTDCPDPGACKTRYCNQGTGMCAPRDAADGGACRAAASGTCRSGACDFCAPNPCQHGGTCTATATGTRCSCPPGYGGANCEMDPCAPNPCQHAGTCSVTASGASCDCAGGYGGDRCEVDGCSPNPCQHGGTCSRTGRGGHSCGCSGGYGGDNCEVDGCAPNPCQHGGTCNRTGRGGHDCDCTGGYSGDDCSDDPCSPNPCPSGIACTRTSSGASCVPSCAPNCRPGDVCATGDQCSTRTCSGDRCACTNGADCNYLNPGECQTTACVSGACRLQDANPGTPCRTTGACNASGSCEYCGDRAVNLQEECDPTASGWNDTTCGSDCQRRVYKRCAADSQCDSGQYCLTYAGICTTRCTGDGSSMGPATECPRVPNGPAPVCYVSYCALPCATDSECPPDVQRCTGNTTLGAYTACSWVN